MSGASLIAEAAARVMRRYPYRGKTFIWNRLEAMLDPADIEVQYATGGRMLIDTRRFWQRQMMAACFERAGAWVVPRLLGAGDVFVDGGANCGYYSCIAAGAVKPGGRVIAFEPDSRLHAQLARQRALNDGLITVEPLALSDRAARATFHVDPAHDPQGLTVGHGSLEPHDAWEQKEVTAVTLDDYLEQHGIEKVRLAKLDLEGHERRAIAGASRSLQSGRIESLLVEVNDRETAGLLMSLEWDEILHVGRGWRTVNAATLGDVQADILCLRGEGARRWNAVRTASRLV